MIQLIVYTGFYWAVKVMESLLVVNSATACALPSSWISTLRGLGVGGETAGLGADCWCSQFTAVMSFLLPEKPHSASPGISAQLWCATVNKASGKERGEGKAGPYLHVGAHSNSFWQMLKVDWGVEWRSMMGGKTDAGGGETVTDITLKLAALPLNLSIAPK